MVGKGKAKLVAALVLLLACVPLGAREKEERQDSLVRLQKATSLQLVERFGRPFRKAIDATFLHNGTYLICDTALWNVDAQIINAEGNVKLIQGETELTSDRLDYFVEEHLAQFRGELVQLRNKKDNILRTRYLDYNTGDSTAVFHNGAAMRDAEGQVIESMDGTYNSAKRVFTFSNNVNMFTDSVFVRTSELMYESNENRVDFLAPISFWQDENMLSASCGWYDRNNETFFFREAVHALSKDQEAWCDTLFFYRTPRDILMLGNAQVQDSSRRSAALADYVFYQDSTSTLLLEKHAAVALETESSARKDILYFGADTLILNTLMKFEIDDEIIQAAKNRKSDMLTDPVSEFRKKAAEAAAKAAAEAMKNDPNRPHPMDAAERKEGGESAGGGLLPAGRDSLKVSGKDVLTSADSTAVPDSLRAVAAALASLTDSLSAPGDSSLSAASLRGALDSLAVPSDSLPVAAGLRSASDTSALRSAIDSLAVPSDSLPVAAGLRSVPDTSALRSVPDTSALRGALDSLAVPSDSLALADSLGNVVLDSTKVAFVTGIGRVKAFRKDIQVLCDSMCYSELDSIARFYIEPVVWNEGNRQYTSDSLFVLLNKKGIDRAALTSNAFIITQEDSLYFDQIKSTDVIAYFDSTSALRRFDALGGANTMFFLKENDAYATVNKVETKMMSATFEKGQLSRVYYFDNPKNDAVPVAQMKKGELQMKDFKWRIDERPNSPEDITPLVVRPSERKFYEGRPRAQFAQTDIYFPGYMPGVYKGIEDAKVRKQLAERRKRAVRDSLARVEDSLKFALIADSLRQVSDSLLAGGLQADSVVVGGEEVAAAVVAGTAVVAGSGVAADSEGKVASAAGEGSGEGGETAVSGSEGEDAKAGMEGKDSVDVAAAGAAAVSAGVVTATAAAAEEGLSAAQIAAQKAAEREARREQAELARSLREAEREARWARLDSLDAAKIAAKEQRKLDRKREHTRRLYLRQLKQNEKDARRLERYVAQYGNRKRREDARTADKLLKKAAADAQIEE